MFILLLMWHLVFLVIFIPALIYFIINQQLTINESAFKN
jgi:hypothetical protein